MKNFITGLIEDLNQAYPQERPELACNAYEDLIMNCWFCGKKINLYQSEVKTNGVKHYVEGVILDGERLRFDDGAELYVCNECLFSIPGGNDASRRHRNKK